MKKEYSYFFVYFFLSILIIGYSLTNNSFTNNMSNDFKSLNLEDVYLIFVMNSLQVLFFFLLAPLGISIVFILKFLYSIGQAPYSTKVDVISFYLSSLTHGLGEIIVCYLVILFTIKHFLCLYRFIRTKKMSEFKKLYLNLIKRYIPLSLLILLLSAFCEVYISNKIFLKLIG